MTSVDDDVLAGLADHLGRLAKLDECGFVLPHGWFVLSLSRLPAWTPERIADELLTVPLTALMDRLAHEYARHGVPAATIADALLWLRAALGKTIGEVVKDKDDLADYDRLLKRTIGATRLADYVLPDTTSVAEVTRWRDETQELLDELRLVASYRASDEDAFAALHEIHARSVFGFLRIKTRNDQDAEDLAQTTWARLWQGAPKYDPDRLRFRLFARRVAENVWKDWLRANKKRRLDLLLSVWQQGLTGSDDTPVDRDLPDPTVDDPAYAVVCAELFDILVTLAYGGASPPHQVVAFHFSRLRMLPPRVIVEGYSEKQLAALASAIVKEYVGAFTRSVNRAESLFGPFQDKMAKTVDQVITDSRSRSLYSHLLTCIVRDTRLQDYFVGKTGDRGAYITQWSASVERRMRSDFERRFMDDV